MTFPSSLKGTRNWPLIWLQKNSKKDYITSINLYWNSENNFKITEKIAENSLKYNSKLEDKILKISDLNKINGERILLLVKRDFGLEEEKNDETYIEIITKKLFYISYTCNELISFLCGKFFEKGFKFKSIFDFYYIVSSSYNLAIEGFTKINFEIKEKQKELENYLKAKKRKKNKENEDEEAPEVAKQKDWI